MKKFSGGLVMIIAVTTAIVFMGINLVDSMVSVIFGLSFTSGFHLGILLMVVGYFLAIGIFCWYFSERKEKGEENDIEKSN